MNNLPLCDFTHVTLHILRMLRCILFNILHFDFHSFYKLQEVNVKNKIKMEQKQREEKVKLFDELIKIEGEDWNAMVANLNKQEEEKREKERIERNKRFDEMEKEEAEEWENAIKENLRKIKMKQIADQMVFLLTNKKQSD